MPPVYLAFTEIPLEVAFPKLSIGRATSTYSSSFCAQAISSLLSLAATKAILVTRDASGNTTFEQEIDAKLVHYGDCLKVKLLFPMV